MASSRPAGASSSIRGSRGRMSAAGSSSRRGVGRAAATNGVAGGRGVGNVLHAVALQQTLARDLGLEHHNPPPLPSQRRHAKLASSAGRTVARTKMTTTAGRGDGVRGDGGSGRGGTFASGRTASLAASTSTSKPAARSSARSSGDVVAVAASSSRHARSEQNEPARREERVLPPGQPRPPPSLAQQIGLEEPAPAPLNEEEWKKVKQRSCVRGDSSQPCPICQDVFGRGRGQVILSCSHTFHLACLSKFESVTVARCQRQPTAAPSRPTCPVCRRHDYERRLIFDGERSEEERCAVRLQSAWRGYVVRTSFRQLLLLAPPPRDPALRQRYLHQHLGHVTALVLQDEQRRSTAVNELITDVNGALAESRRVMRQAELFLLCNSGGENDVVVSKATEPVSLWQHVAQVALSRHGNDDECSECAICMMPMPSLQSSGGVAPGGCHGDVFLLSCSHLFHVPCLVAMESFTCGSVLRCPVCRSTYLRIPWTSRVLAQLSEKA